MTLAVDCVNFALLLICSRVFHLALGLSAEYYKAQLDAHLKLHNEKWSSEDVRKCKLCNRQFTQPALYRLHIREHYRLQAKIMKQTKRGTTQKTIYKCRICMKIFQKPSQLMRHIRVHTGEKPFKCTACTRAFSQKSSLQIHMWQHNGVRPYPCSHCNARFSQKGNLNAHIQRVHSNSEGQSTYACSHCSCVYKKLGSLNAHLKKMHAMPTEETPKCDSSTENLPTEQTPEPSINLGESIPSQSSKSDILQQALTNSGLTSKEKSSDPENLDSQTSYVTLVDRTPDGSFRKYITIKQRRIGSIRWYVCSVCHKEFKKPSDLIRHLRVHTQEKPFKCSHCPRSFSLKSTVKGHEKTHFVTKKYTCGICDESFSCHSTLNAHTRTHTKPHKCDICDMTFSTSTLLKGHMKGHFKTKGDLCPEAERLVPKIVLEEPLLISDAGNKICVAQVRTKQRHVYNAEEEVNRPHKCWVCPAAFRKISHLKQHYRRHTGERPFKCSKCDRRFTSNSVLKAHLHTHEDARPFSCHVCHAKFSTLSSQKRHLVTHSNKRPFMCPYCHKTFKTSVNCRKHMKVHKNELAQQQLEKQSNGEDPEEEREEREAMHVREDLDFAGNMTTDFDEVFDEQLGEMGRKGKKSTEEKIPTAMSENMRPAESSNLNVSQTLHADETGTITLPNYTGEQSLTAESIREIEETLNQQLFNIGLGNLQLPLTLTRQITDSTTAPLTSAQQPVLNIIYDSSKVLEPPTPATLAPSIFESPHFDTFDMSHITLQADAEIDLGISSANSTSMASILPRSAQEEQRMISTSTCLQPVHAKPRQYVVVQMPQSQEIRSVPSRSKYPKVIAKADTTDTNGLLSLDNDSTLDKSPNLPESPDPLSSLFPPEPTEDTSLQCHLCLEKGFTAATLKPHLKSHRDSKQFQCPDCPLQFCTNGGLTRHQKIHKQAVNCPTCMEVLSNDIQLKIHMKRHENYSWKTSTEPDSSQKDPTVEPTLSTINSKLDKDFSVSERILRNSVVKRDNIEMTNGEMKEKKEYMNKCEYCPKTFRKPSDLVRHTRTHTGERPYQCPHCEKSFAVKCTLDSHVKVHEGTKSYGCHVCSSLFSTKGSLAVHMRLHTGAKPFKCPICDQQFRTSGHRKVHLSSHAKDSKNERRQRRKQKENCKAPVVDVDKTETPLTVPGLGDVQQGEYTGVNTITIDADGIGDQLTFNPDGTIVNNNSVLSVNESNQLVANLHFLLSNGLVTIQTDEAALLQLNEGSVNQEGNLMADNVENRCDNVQENLLLTGQLQLPGGQEQPQLQLENCMALVEMPTGEIQASGQTPMPIAVFKGKGKGPSVTKECDVCGKTFLKPCQVERHKRIHTGERPFKCDICAKSFAQKVTLQMHQKHHTGDRPYLCPHCDHSFTQKGNLQTHLRRVHQLDVIEEKKFKREEPMSTKVPQDVDKLLNLDGISLVEFLR